jgi:hypothetical protein
VRTSAASLNTPASAVFSKYTVMINRLLGVNYELGEGLPGEDLSEQTDALGSLAAAEEAASVQRATIYGALNADAFTRSDFAALSTAHAAWTANVPGVAHTAREVHLSSARARRRAGQPDRAIRIGE